MSAKQRSYARHPITLRVRVRTTKGWVEMETLDISRRGVFIRTDDPLDEQKIAQLRMTMPNGRELDAMGHVRRAVREPAPGEHGMGIEFFVMSKEAEEEWDRFVLGQSRNASGVSSVLVAVDATQQPSGSASLASAMVELPVVRESVEALLPKGRRSSAMVNEPTMVATGADARGALVVAREESGPHPRIPVVEPKGHDERSVFLADVHAETFPAWESGGLPAEAAAQRSTLNEVASARAPLSSFVDDVEDDDVPWSPARRRSSAKEAVQPATAKIAGPDEEAEEAQVLSRRGMASAFGGDSRAALGGSRANLRNAGHELPRSSAQEERSQRLWGAKGPVGPDVVIQPSEAMGQGRPPTPRAAGAELDNTKTRPSAIQGPTVATGTRHTTTLAAGMAKAQVAHDRPELAHAPTAGTTALAPSHGASSATMPAAVPAPLRRASEQSPPHKREQATGRAEVAMAHDEGGGIFITVRPGDVGHLRQFMERRMRQANVFLRSTVSCTPGQPVDVAVVHPNTDAEVIVSGTVARVIRGETEAENGFLLRFSDLDDQLLAALEQFVETGHPEVRAPTAVQGENQRDLRQAAEKATDSADAWLVYGWSLLSESENPVEAIEAFQRALMMTPERAEIHDGLSLAYALAGEAAKSYAFLRSSRQLAQTPQP